MAIKTTQLDDFTGEELEPNTPKTRLTIDGKTYLLDLGPNSVKALWEAVEPFIKNVDPEPKSEKGRVSSRSSSTTSDLDAAAVREWAKLQNIPTNPRGRLSAALQQAYRAAHGL